MELLSSPFLLTFDHFFDRIENHCFIASPYITLEPARRLVQALEKKQNFHNITVTVLTDLSVSNLAQGSTDINALLFLCANLSALRLYYLPALHAKVYIANDDFAIIGSANFTSGGSTRNFEYGIRLFDPTLVKKVAEDMAAYANLGNSVSYDNLKVLKVRIDELKDAIREEKAVINRKTRRVTEEIERQTQDELLRIQVHGRTIHAIFVDTILYLMRERALTTHEIENGVETLHPNLCDETQDRVIDGKHFGKLWKHQVRTAQVTLRRKNVIEYDVETRLWRRRN